MPLAQYRVKHSLFAKVMRKVDPSIEPGHSDCRGSAAGPQDGACFKWRALD